MDGEAFVKALSKKLGANQAELAKILGKNPVQISGWKKKTLSATTLAGIVATLVNQRVTAADLLPALQRKFGEDTTTALAGALGMSTMALRNWKLKHAGLSALQIANAIQTATEQASSEAKRLMIQPIVEFIPIEREPAGAKFQLFKTREKARRYHIELKKVLSEKQGVYLFYDSRGHALYAGKTSRQGLWKEMNLAFNRNRDTQSIKLVNHPKFGAAYKTTDEKDRQIKNTNLRLHELAAYFSAFEVEDSMISNVEALLVRAFPNDLLNSKMERFEAARTKRALAAKKKANNQEH